MSSTRTSWEQSRSSRHSERRSSLAPSKLLEIPSTLWSDRCGRMEDMETAKEQVEEILQALPEDASLEDIQYHIYVRQRIQQGLEDVEAGRVVSHAEVQKRLAKWLSK